MTGASFEETTITGGIGVGVGTGVAVGLGIRLGVCPRTQIHPKTIAIERRAAIDMLDRNGPAQVPLESGVFIILGYLCYE
jgi:hypothetical protein